MLRFVSEYLVFALIGVVLGKGPFGMESGQWWAWLLALTFAVQLHDAALRK